MRKLRLPSGDEIPVLGQGTWRMGEQAKQRGAEVKALQLGLDLGMTLIDTAEMYADGKSEEVVAEAMAGRRDQVYLVTKVLPSNASRKGVAAAAERSLKRLKTDRIDLYLLHWRGGEPLAETLAGFHDLLNAGKIRSYGVSNFDVNDMKEWLALKDGTEVQANQVLYNVATRGIDFDLVRWQAERGIPIMAYSPLAQGRLPKSGALKAVAARHDATVGQVMLAWCLRHKHVFAVPKTSRLEGVTENAAAADLLLTGADLAEIDRDFPPPNRAKPLEML
ncbi:aldo/keto reductase [Dongia sedimenti]|uniref:Aldo/keto reductase n=1 Tax=Dongia sedimenti TaxID=3064282 RepID=A0ABU0YK40_9PROT|nr:aldo/keto reductase [Rhodospirillaceae bacterium R-7]